MKHVKIALFIISFLSISFDVAIAGKKHRSNKQAQQDQLILDPVYLEHEIIEHLHNRLKNIKVEPDFNHLMVARHLYDISLIKNLKLHTMQLEKIINNAVQLALDEGLDTISRNHISFAANQINIHDKNARAYAYFSRNDRKLVATHEAGHAVGIVYLLHDYKILYEISMLGFDEKLLAYALPLHIYNCQSKQARIYNELAHMKLMIAFLLCGGVANQVNAIFASSINSLLDKTTGLQEIFLDSRCAGDLQQINGIFQELIIFNIMDQAQVDQTRDQIMEEAYQVAFACIVQHKTELERLSNLLMKKNMITGDEVYALFGVERPLFDFERAPLAQAEIVDKQQTKPKKKSRITRKRGKS